MNNTDWDSIHDDDKAAAMRHWNTRPKPHHAQTRMDIDRNLSRRITANVDILRKLDKIDRTVSGDPPARLRVWHTASWPYPRT